jgi:hypothetical protein
MFALLRLCDIFYLNRIVFSGSSNLCVNPANDFEASILLARRWKNNYKYVYVFFIVLSLVPRQDFNIAGSIVW